MTKLGLIATALWRQDALRCDMPSVADRRTYEAFQCESIETQEKWFGYARAAVNVIDSKEK